MRKHIYVTGFVITGAAALFVGLAGNARAIPDSIRSWTSSNQQNDHDVVSSIGRYDDNQSPNGTISSVMFAADLKENMGKPHVLGVRTFDRPDGIISSVVFGADLKENMGKPHLMSVRIFDRNVQTGSPASVPDGGTTVIMMGGALCGLFLLTKKLKV